MAPTSPPKLHLFGELNAIISKKDAGALAKLLNEQKSDSSELASLLRATAQRLILKAESQLDEMDTLVEFITDCAYQIDPTLTHKGNEAEEGDVPKSRSVSGPELLAEYIAAQLSFELWDCTSRVYTPQPEDDKNKGRDYYRSAYVRSALLARIFALNWNFRHSIWRPIEEVLVKGLFSGTMQEPGNFIAIPVILWGAGAAVKKWLGKNGGKGKSWFQYTNEINEPDAKWGWNDVTAALRDEVSIFDSDFAKSLPPAVVKTFKELSGYIDCSVADFSSLELWEKFSWIEELP